MLIFNTTPQRTNKLRSFIGTFAITQRSSRCDDYEVKINADVQTSYSNDNNGNGNRNRRDCADGSYGNNCDQGATRGGVY